MAAALELREITKRFGPVVALRGATLAAERGEIHALLGENGSGKTTLMRVLEGGLAPDDGEVIIEGQSRELASLSEVRATGIGVVSQHPASALDLTVGENVLMGRLPRRRGLVDRATLRRESASALAEIGADLDPGTPVSRLSPDQRQLVEIARVVSARPWLLALDEPTASLTADQVERLFAVLRRLRDEGCLIIYISHRLREIFDLCDRVTVLRDGETRATLPVADADTDTLVRLMVGRELGATERTWASEPGKSALELRGLSRGDVLRDVSLDVRAGEIVGIAGLVGAGRSALIRTIYGLRRPDGGEVLIDGEPVFLDSPRAAIARGIVLVPEDRHESGLCLDLSIAENIALGRYGRRSLVSLTRARAARGTTERLMRELEIRAAGPEVATRLLSGGNQQKVALARWLAERPHVLILDEPTRGIDVGAKAEIYRLLDSLAADGIAVLVSSSELPELLTLCDRIYAMYRGRLVAHFSHDEATEEAIAAAIAGAAAQPLEAT